MNGVDGVVLAVIQITDDPSAERTAPPRSTHMQPGDVSHALIQQGEKERLWKTPSSSSTTAWWWWRSVALQQGFAKHCEKEEEVLEGRGLRQGQGCAAPMRLPTIYRGGGGWFLALQVLGIVACNFKKFPTITQDLTMEMHRYEGRVCLHTLVDR